MVSLPAPNSSVSLLVQVSWRICAPDQYIASGGMKKSAWAPAPNLEVNVIARNDADWTISVNGRDHGLCPGCGIRSLSRHSSYLRTLRDLPAQGTPVSVQARLTRWRCRNDLCEKRSRSAFQGWPGHSLAELRVCPASFGFSGIRHAALRASCASGYRCCPKRGA